MQKIHRRWGAALAVGTVAMGLSGCASWGWGTPQDFLDVYKLPPPSEHSATLCHAYSCQARTRVTFLPREWNQVAAFFAEVKTPAQERAAISAAIADFEEMTGPRMGTRNDPGGVIDARFSGDPSHLDCVDEAANSTSYLLLLEQNGLLRHHRTAPPDIRGFFLDGRYQHYSAVIQELKSGAPWVVDSWVRDNGQPPVMAPLSQWRASYGGL